MSPDPNLPLAGFIAAAEHDGHALVSTLRASCAPSGPVTKEAFEAISDELIARIVEAGPIDAVYLDLHGAMVCAHLPDGEGELLARLRARIGNVPIVATLDFHANVTSRMVEQADLLVAYRTYPHVDMAETGARLARQIPTVMRQRPFKALRRAEYLVPLHWQTTLAQPMAGLMDVTANAEQEDIGVVSASLAAGFAMAGIFEAGHSVLVYAKTQEKPDLTADRLIAAFTEAEPAFSGRLFSPAEAVAGSLHSAAMVILVDTQDNPGAGGTADTTGLLRERLKQNVPAALLGVLCDPEVAAAAHIAGVGGTISTPLDGKAGPLGGPPIQADWQVEALGDGAITGTGPFYLGCRMQLGPMARLSCKGVHVIISSRRQQAADQAMFRHLGVEPAEWPILCLKSSVHFRADFGALTADIRIVVAEGENIADPSRLSYRNLRPTARIAPMGAVNGAGIHP